MGDRQRLRDCEAAFCGIDYKKRSRANCLKVIVSEVASFLRRAIENGWGITVYLCPITLVV